ncbi:related to helicases of the Snf2/Rad54 family [Rhynchosporium agropyri]|uniref:DNA helicase n=1 Tax=Rhynchosporium agropyri TaxID=914238 RepID=A0A1E1K0N9_9HELO|nr:related to helicases of the Snf2/Rad54 family [Rhynchosporium agropyri]
MDSADKEARPGSPPAKRQRTANGYKSTSNSEQNTNAYNSDNDSGDDLLAGYIPETPTQNTYQTQATQILDRSTLALPTPSPPGTPQHIVQVPASSPFTGRDSEGSKSVYFGGSSQSQNVPPPPRPQLAQGMAPAGTVYKAPAGVIAKPPPSKTYVTLDDDEDDGPKFQGASSDDDGSMQSANIKPTTFMSNSAHNSFGNSTSNGAPRTANGTASFQDVMRNSAYQPLAPGRNPQFQTRPDRARPVPQDITIEMALPNLRQNIVRMRLMFPKISVLTAQNFLVTAKGNLNDAVELYVKDSERDEQRSTETISISDDEIDSPQQAESQFKRTLAAPIQSLRDRYSSTQALLPRNPAAVATPPKPRRKLMKGRRNASSPAPAAASSPLKLQSPAPAESVDYDSDDSGVASESEPDPELEGRLLKYFNTCKVMDLVELTSITKDVAEVMIAARPFKTLSAARTVENTKATKSGKKSNRAPIGDKIVQTALDMFQGYEAIDTLVTKCGDLGKPLAEEMSKWGFDVFGASKTGELEMTSLEDDTESQRDSGIGSPSSAANSNNGDDDIKIVSSTRKRGNVKFLKKPEMMADDCVLKDYQVVGLNWMALMYRHKLSCILADEMGLGKTCQVIAFLTHLVENGHPGPHLVVCPGSTLENWLREFQRFSPQLAIEPYHGPQKERTEMALQILDNRDTINVVVTTYDMAAKKEDNKFMKKLKPDVCVYDEGHMLKNVKSQRYQGLVKIPATFRLLLTGTPLQNNLQELAALLAFILPDVFKEVEEDLTFIFKAKASTADADHAALLSAQRIARARSMLTPFVLRRKKAQVLKHLPAKLCRVQYCDLHESQKGVYNGHLDAARERARARLEGVKAPKTEENNPLMQLRKAAIHPLLFRRHFSDEKIEKMVDILRKKDPVNFPASHKRAHLVEEMHKGSDFWLHQWCLDYPCIRSFDIPNVAWMDSGKVETMIELVKGYKKNGDRVLIFSQFALVLDILEAVMNTSSIVYTRIDGSTKIEERQPLIDAFKEDESITAFLLTTKAGGTGINLMYANKVIIFDGSFNPQDDRQAENRAHRVGQVREVEVVRLVTRGTVEEAIYALGQSKLTLDGRVAGDSEDGGKAEEAGEKAVARMLLEGTTGSADDEANEDAKVEETKPKKDEKLSQRKKSSIMGMLTNPGAKGESQESEKGSQKKPVKIDEGGEDMFL